MLDFPSLDPWINQDLRVSRVLVNKRYMHSVLLERLEYRDEKLPLLKDFVFKAHDDARKKLRKLAGISLDPFDSGPRADPAMGYPGILHERTLQGYFGELMAGIFVETCSPDGVPGWKVPAFMFTSHGLAFDKLELWHQDAERLPGLIPGQHGNDCLGFLLDREGRILKCVVCESKCSLDHRADLISDAHKTFKSEPRPASLWQLIEILDLREDDESHQWVERLRGLWNALPAGYERHDLVMYVCGRAPAREESWMDRNVPNTEYSQKRELHAVEVHLANIQALIAYVYETDLHANN